MSAAKRRRSRKAPAPKKRYGRDPVQLQGIPGIEGSLADRYLRLDPTTRAKVDALAKVRPVTDATRQEMLDLIWPVRSEKTADRNCVDEVAAVLTFLSWHEPLRDATPEGSERSLIAWGQQLVYEWLREMLDASSVSS